MSICIQEAFVQSSLSTVALTPPPNRCTLEPDFQSGMCKQLLAGIFGHFLPGLSMNNSFHPLGREQMMVRLIIITILMNFLSSTEHILSEKQLAIFFVKGL